MYLPTIGLEIHIELNTKRKMFCSCLNDPDEKKPNKNVCPICLAHPGALPTINKKAVEETIKLGLALNGDIAKNSRFDRKSYFYPDLPKGYQISQYDLPLVSGGSLKGISLRRIHLEEDTARLAHAESSESYQLKVKSSLVDFNRAGVPLLELVTEPEIKNGEEAMAFAKELRLILRYLRISNADMEKGNMRIEANVSIAPCPRLSASNRSPRKSAVLGTKVEVKNINSFKAVGEAIEYELKRQEERLEKGEKIIPETRGWNEFKKQTESQRIKEEAHDYRYFPEPDLPNLNLTKSDLINIEDLKRHLPELPEHKRRRFAEEFNLSEKQSDVLINDPESARFFEEAVSELKSELPTSNVQLLFNYFTSDLFGLMKNENIGWDDLNITPENFADLIVLISNGDLTSRMAKDIIVEMQASGEDPRAIIKRMDMSQVSDEESVRVAVKESISENPKATGDYKKGNENSLKFLVGQTMKKLKGRGNPELIQQTLKQELA
ncbi:glutaminyl-tRNA synthase (glutamine-hydrolyzing) subunit B [Candidatus Jorgensenbacteria bacterium RIFCSPLOWO2_01_FULL_45_25b]|uniref:Aspartyl/glutamyl-tRNA(Asn/Gln) amidotransferase subunit B n=1 Tax=Candidatus Jorgensenbacteria bacterium RIFCSPLOWO2_01_FULL_45_25b TaxID=1798471 RepID=A0A1F6BZ95_9BACT|nr:MAG: glutaminyl-tRNA synthase (glutamine-hydrolyzing) subunit B [Candidatus Jorgensenbacteria bacterium RIFCSPLOWO2_01_FULL_45_25b]